MTSLFSGSSLTLSLAAAKPLEAAREAGRLDGKMTDPPRRERMGEEAKMGKNVLGFVFEKVQEEELEREGMYGWVYSGWKCMSREWD